MLERIKTSPLYLKLFVWEYWPMELAVVPTVFIWLWFSLRARSLFFFSAVNPTIETGGMMGERKNRIMQQLPQQHLPKTVFVQRGDSWERVQAELARQGLSFPLIAKPNVGERGFEVRKLENAEELQGYFDRHDMDFLIQEFVALPVEISVLYHRFPGQNRGAITSVCLKEFLSVRGDGRSSIRELMARAPRANLQLPRFKKEKPGLLAQAPAAGEQVLLEPIGNHCRGTAFLSGNHHIDPELTAVFDRISREMNGIHYGRFDMKCSSIDELRQGKGFSILEYNGVSSDPAHIYDPAIPVWEKYRDIYRHWAIIYQIYRQQRTRGYRPMTWPEALAAWKDYRAYKKAVQTVL
jgi:hypothetical protein